MSTALSPSPHELKTLQSHIFRRHVLVRDATREHGCAQWGQEETGQGPCHLQHRPHKACAKFLSIFAVLTWHPETHPLTCSPPGLHAAVRRT